MKMHDKGGPEMKDFTKKLIADSHAAQKTPKQRWRMMVQSARKKLETPTASSYFSAAAVIETDERLRQLETKLIAPTSEGATDEVTALHKVAVNRGDLRRFVESSMYRIDPLNNCDIESWGRAETKLLDALSTGGE